MSGRNRKVPLTLAEHQAIDETLYTIRTTLVSISVWVGNTYRHEKLRYVVPIEKKIDRLRCKLDDHVYREFPQRGHPANAYVYYPGLTKPLDTSGIAWQTTSKLPLRQWGMKPTFSSHDQSLSSLSRTTCGVELLLRSVWYS
jgi:hypothetical protein